MLNSCGFISKLVDLHNQHEKIPTAVLHILACALKWSFSYLSRRRERNEPSNISDGGNRSIIAKQLKNETPAQFVNRFTVKSYRACLIEIFAEDNIFTLILLLFLSLHDNDLLFHSDAPSGGSMLKNTL